MAVTGLNHITLAVSDLDRSCAFYVDLLGAVLRARSDRLVYLELGSIWLCLEWAQTVTPRADGSHIAFSCEPSDFKRLSREISVQAPLWKENRSEGASVYFLDPDGHRLELHLGDLESRLAHYRAHPDKGVRVVDP